MCLYINGSVISCPVISHSINVFSYEDSRKHRRGPDYPEPADEGHTQWNTPLINSTVHVQEQ